jgi:hypothetical protein
MYPSLISLSRQLNISKSSLRETVTVGLAHVFCLNGDKIDDLKMRHHQGFTSALTNGDSADGDGITNPGKWGTEVPGALTTPNHQNNLKIRFFPQQLILPSKEAF